MSQLDPAHLTSCQEHDAAPEAEAHPGEEEDGGAQGAGRLPTPVSVQPLLQQPGQSGEHYHHHHLTRHQTHPYTPWQAV